MYRITLVAHGDRIIEFYGEERYRFDYVRRFRDDVELAAGFSLYRTVVEDRIVMAIDIPEYEGEGDCVIRQCVFDDPDIDQISQRIAELDILRFVGEFAARADLEVELEEFAENLRTMCLIQFDRM